MDESVHSASSDEACGRTDEFHRAKDSGLRFLRNVFPLIGLGFDRTRCMEYLTECGFGETVKSACVSDVLPRAGEDNGVLICTAAYAGMRWGELAGLQWSRTRLDDAEIVIDAEVGALHEVNGRLVLGPPKTAAGARTVALPPLLVVKLAEHRRRHPDARFVFTGADGGLLRRRVWLPALTGNPELGEQPLLPGFDLRHTHKTWLIEDGIPEIAQHKRLGYKLAGVQGSTHM